MSVIVEQPRGHLSLRFMSPSTLLSLPFGFPDWMPVFQAMFLGLLTLVQEDLSAVGGAVLAASGQISWSAAWWGCFLGIWGGDALLYLTARWFGRPLLRYRWVGRFFDAGAVARSEVWFASKGSWLLVTSRFVPGTRLPTYLAAGFLRLPFRRFLGVTGVTVGIWTVVIFLLAAWWGREGVGWIQRGSGSVAIGWLSVIGFWFFLRWAMRWMNAERRRSWAAAWGRCQRWEFWPAWLFYLPVGIHYLWLAIRYRGITLPTAANPGIYAGGVVGESKIATLSELMATSPAFTADAYWIAPGEVADRLRRVAELRAEHGIGLPFVLKPDLGQRGVGVKLIRTEDQVESSLRENSAPLLLQRYAEGPNEVGVFYYRLPGAKRGQVFAITEKVFPTLVGDGRSSVEELIWRDPRARLIAETYLRRLGERRREIPAAGSVVRLVEAGNHAQGCIFRDGAALGSHALEERIDEISKKIEGFHIGRYDLRFDRVEDLRSGERFQIVELNGAASEATSIYDARNSLGTAYRTLFRQWDLVFAIGAANRARGVVPMSLGELWRSWRRTSALISSYPVAD